MAKPKLQVPVTLTLSEKTVEMYRADSAVQNPSDNIQVRASIVMEGLANGGMYLRPDQVVKIEKTIEKGVETGEDIVAAVGKTVGLEDGQNVFQFSIDPTYLEPFKERALEASKTPAELMHDVVDYAFENNWVYGFSVEGTRRTFTPSDEAALSEVLGKGFTVRDIVGKLCKTPVAA